MSTATAVAYAAPLVGSYFYYLPMWGILPGIYAKYFGLQLSALAAALLIIRLFDGTVDLAVGLLSDWHRSRGGSRKTWVIAGGIASIIACSFLFVPPAEVSTSYYLCWSLVYFLALTISEIPHQTWGSELTFEYQARARIFGFRSAGLQIGAAAFYALPLLPIYASTNYTPRVLRDAVYIGAIMTLVGVLWATMVVPRGITIKAEKMSRRSITQAMVGNRPLHCLVAACALAGIGFGMWIGLAYIYMDSYLGLGRQFAIIFFASTAFAAVSTPFWLKVIEHTDKATAWAVGVCVFVGYLACMFFVRPGQLWLAAILLVFVSPLYTTASNVAAASIMGDIVDYGKLKFHKDFGATYFALNLFLFKISIGVGGALAFGVAGLFRFNLADSVHSVASIFGLKLAFIVLPGLFMLSSLPFILQMPITRDRHRIIQRRLQSRIACTLTPGDVKLSSTRSSR